MPMYDYYCLWCDRSEERNVSMADRDLQDCPTCRVPMDRLVSKGTSFKFAKAKRQRSVAWGAE